MLCGEGCFSGREPRRSLACILCPLFLRPARQTLSVPGRERNAHGSPEQAPPQQAGSFWVRHRAVLISRKWAKYRSNRYSAASSREFCCIRCRPEPPILLFRLFEGSRLSLPFTGTPHHNEQTQKLFRTQNDKTRYKIRHGDRGWSFIAWNCKG